MMRFAALFAALLVSCTTAGAQSAQPYGGLQNRPIKALSEQQQAELRGGRGAGMALAAELNGYPGPLHVLELAGPMQLTPDQRQKVQVLFDAMKSEASAKGEVLIAREAELDRMFVDRSVTEPRLIAATKAIGDVQADLRATHLKYHLSTLALLSRDQVQKYTELRGYGDRSAPHGHQHQKH